MPMLANCPRPRVPRQRQRNHRRTGAARTSGRGEPWRNRSVPQQGAEPGARRATPSGRETMKHSTKPRTQQIRTIEPIPCRDFRRCHVLRGTDPHGRRADAATASPSPWETVHEDYEATFENFCVAGPHGGRPWLDRLPLQDHDTWRRQLVLLHRAHHVLHRHLHQRGQRQGGRTNSGKYTFTAVRVTDNGDGTLTIIYQYAVNTRLADDAGQVVAHDTGLHRYVSVVDHNGTPSDPSDD